LASFATLREISRKAATPAKWQSVLLVFGCAILRYVVIGFPDGKAYPVTAREMTAKEKRRYRKWKGR
jgi:hypothetical protein